MRLACVRHAASVRSEPGSNSQVHHTRHHRTGHTRPARHKARTTNGPERTQTPRRGTKAPPRTTTRSPRSRARPDTRTTGQGAPPTYPFHSSQMKLSQSQVQRTDRLTASLQWPSKKQAQRSRRFGEREIARRFSSFKPDNTVQACARRIPTVGASPGPRPNSAHREPDAVPHLP